jgi:hypothetical protein
MVTTKKFNSIKRYKMKSIRKYRAAIPPIFLSALLLFSIQNKAHSIPTKWEDARMSLSELLDTDWQIAAHGATRVAANSNAGNGFDVVTNSFLLTKNKKYIICFVQNPSPPIANIASCRRLN